MDVAGEFRLSRSQAREILKEVAEVTGRWDSTASELGVDDDQLDLMTRAFEHDAATATRALVAR